MYQKLFIAVGLFGLLLFAVSVKNPPEKHLTALEEVDQTSSTQLGEPEYNPPFISIARLPEPTIISEERDIGIISDERLRRFVRANALFGRDKVLYFEWEGGEADGMDGKMTSDLETRDDRYVISLKTNAGNLRHRQVFIVPKNCTYEVDISDE